MVEEDDLPAATRQVAELGQLVERRDGHHLGGESAGRRGDGAAEPEHRQAPRRRGDDLGRLLAALPNRHAHRIERDVLLPVGDERVVGPDDGPLQRRRAGHSRPELVGQRCDPAVGALAGDVGVGDPFGGLGVGRDVAPLPSSSRGCPGDSRARQEAISATTSAGTATRDGLHDERNIRAIDPGRKMKRIGHQPAKTGEIVAAEDRT